MKITAKRLKQIIMEEMAYQREEMDPESLALKAVLMSALAELEDPNTKADDIKRKVEDALK